MIRGKLHGDKNLWPTTITVDSKRDFPDSEQLVVQWAKKCMALEKENERLHQIVRDLKARVFDLENPAMQITESQASQTNATGKE